MAQPSIDTFRAALRGRAIERGDPEYESARKLYNGMIDKRPALIVRCADVADVISAVNFGREQGLDVAVRGGGHNGAGLALVDGGLVIDLSPMRGVRVDPDARTAQVAGGSQLGDLDHAAHAFGLGTPAGILSTTGVSGLTLGGGHGYLTRKYGLTIDNLLAVDVYTMSTARRSPPGSPWCACIRFDGAPRRVGKNDAAWSYRDAVWSGVIGGIDPDPANASIIKKWCVDYWEALHPTSMGGAYVNFMMEEGAERVRATYRDNYDRLARIKKKYDPKNFFHVNQNIKPAT
jgi:FAD/FMN-containing dehydrogenase